MSISFKARLLKKSLLIGGCLILGSAMAGGIEPAMPLPMPGFSVYGLGGNGWTAMGDMLAPVFGQSSSFVHVDPQIYYHTGGDGGYTGSVGAGYRRLTENNGILGAYVFGDYNRTPDSHSFWFVSPGIERLGERLDFSANGYIPVSNQKIYSGQAFLDQVGDSSQVTFSGHDQYDMLVNTFTSTGYGADAQVGVHLPAFLRNSEVFLGGYYFAPKDTSTIGGGAVRLQVPINSYISALVSEAYDSQFHNTIKAGLTIWFGGRHTGYHATGDLNERLVDPIQRNLVAVAGGAHTAQPSLSDYDNTGQTVLELSNISFFVPGGVPEESGDPTVVQGDGTYENPYVGMTQDNVDDGNAQGNQNFYVDSGTYNAVYNASNPDYIVLNNDQVYGRQNNFKEAAQGNNRALINFSNGGFEIPGSDINDSITGLRLVGANMDGNAGIWIDHEASPLNQTVTINNTSVQAFGDGIDMVSGGNSTLTVNVNNSLISNNNGTGELFAFGITGGIGALNTNAANLNLNVTGTTISNNNKTFTNANIVAVGGLAVTNLGDTTTVNVNQSTLTGNHISADDSGVVAAGGLAAVNDGGNMLLNVYRSTLTGNSISASNNSFVDTAGGLAISNTNTMTLNVYRSTLSGNSINADDSTITSAGGMAIDNLGNTMTINVKRSTFSANSITANNISQIAAAGGMAVTNFGEMTINVSHSAFTGNNITVDDSNISGAAGGLAVANVSNMTINVLGSNLSGNTISADDFSNIGVAGGLAAANGLGNMTINVFGSNLSGNTVSANNSSTVDTAGGLAVLNDQLANSLTINVSHSNLSNNTVTTDNGATTAVAGGLAVDDASTGITNINVNSSNLSGNTVTAPVSGGMAIENVNGSTMTIDVQQSVFANNNTNGIDVDGGGAVTVNRSIIFGNTISGLTANGGTVIDVTNPIFFDGVVNFDGGSAINFVGGPVVTSGDHVVCSLFGSCVIVP